MTQPGVDAVVEREESPSLARGVAALAPVVAGALLAAVLIQGFVGGRRTDFEELALGEQTTSLYARVGEQPIHCRGVADAPGCIEGSRARGSRAVALWLGNSQLHAVNQLRPGQENAPPILFRDLEPRGIDLLTFSQPNANLQEHLVLFEYLRRRLPLRELVLPVVFDDLREAGLRPDIALALADPPTREALAASEVGRSILADAELAPTDLAGVRRTVQEHAEKALTGVLERHSALWSLRPQARGQLFVDLRRLRNTVFGITAQSKRRLLQGRYRRNLAALESILGAAADDGIETLVYVPPLRNDVDVPYVVEEYARFKDELRRLVRARGGRFADFESLVPAEQWGTKSSTTVAGGGEIDFMHFRAEGHERLAAAVARELNGVAARDPS